VEPFGEKVVLPPIDDLPCTNSTCTRYLLRDLWVYDWPTNTWFNIEPAPGSQVPRPRAQHAGGIVGNANGAHGLKLVVYGGYMVGDSQNMELTDETWMASLPPMTADLATLGVVTAFWSRIEQLYMPIARYGHGFTLMGMYSLLMVGGTDVNGGFPKDIWEFVYAVDGDTNPSVFATSPIGWYKLDGRMPYGLTEFAMSSLVSKNRSAAYVFGGQIAGEYAYFSYEMLRYVPGCGAGVVFDPECHDYFLWDCPCKACPPGSYASEFDFSCTSCPNLGWTVSSHTSSIGEQRG
jgi:hypothetical protein